MSLVANCGGALPAENVRLIVVHYTGGDSVESAVAWFRNRSSKVSAHVVIGRDGKCAWPVPYNRVAWHAGKSSWGQYSALNVWSIGIELVNLGPLVQRGQEFTTLVATGKRIKAKDVYIGYHKNGVSQHRYWHKYTPEQIDKLRETVVELKTMFPRIEAVVGHDDVAPERKLDPGPALADEMPKLQDLLKSL